MRTKMGPVLESRIVESVAPSDASPRAVAQEMRDRLDDGWELRPAGGAKANPFGLFSAGYTPRYKFSVFGTDFYLSSQRVDENFRFFVTYVANPPRRGRRRLIVPRIFYKDQSLIWRCATHFIRSEKENWIGKGDLKQLTVNGVEMEFTAEETTDLPYEVQTAMDLVSRRAGSPHRDLRAIPLILRQAPDDRLDPYEDFLAPRRRAASNPRNLTHGGKLVASFRRANDPSSLHFATGFEPDFLRGVVDVSRSKSRLYGGLIRRFRILSRNRKIQYLFVAAPKLVWIIPPQTLTTELSSYGVRTVDAKADDDLCVPGYEYHFVDDSYDPPVFYSQIPEGFAGPASEVDPSRASAGPWLDRLPVIRKFRRARLR